jgi:hypothetical protein
VTADSIANNDPFLSGVDAQSLAEPKHSLGEASPFLALIIGAVMCEHNMQA